MAWHLCLYAGGQFEHEPNRQNPGLRQLLTGHRIDVPLIVVDAGIRSRPNIETRSHILVIGENRSEDLETQLAEQGCRF